MGAPDHIFRDNSACSGDVGCRKLCSALLHVGDALWDNPVLIRRRNVASPSVPDSLAFVHDPITFDYLLPGHLPAATAGLETGCWDTGRIARAERV